MKNSFWLSLGALGESAWLLKAHSWPSSGCAAFTSGFRYVPFLLHMNLTIRANTVTVTKITTAITPRRHKMQNGLGKMKSYSLY